MPRHVEKRLVPYAAPQIFALVADVESYPAFLPWCLEASVYGRRRDRFDADLIVGIKGLRERFTSHVTLEEPHAIRVAYGGGPLAHLHNEWSFRPLGEASCEIGFTLDFRLRSKLLSAMMDLAFEAAFRAMAAAFEARARELYG